MKAFQKLIIPYVIFMACFIILPMLLITLYAFSRPGNDIVAFHFTLSNFVRFLEPVFLKILFKSLQIALVTTVLTLLIGYPIAYYVSKMRENIQMLVVLLITMPMWINMLIRTYAWISILGNNGLLNSVLHQIGMGNVNILYTDSSVILGMVYNYLPFMIISIHAQLAKMDNQLIQASYDLGANRFLTFWKIVFPLSIPGVITGITLVFLPAVSSFVIPKLLGGGNYMLIGNLIENQFGTAGNWNFGSAISMIMAFVIIVTMSLTKKVDRQQDNVDKNNKLSRSGSYGVN